MINSVAEVIEKIREIFDVEGSLEFGTRPSLGKVYSFGSLTASDLEILIKAAPVWQPIETAPRDQSEILGYNIHRCEYDDVDVDYFDVMAWQAAEIDYKQVTLEEMISKPEIRPVIKRYGWFRPHEGAEVDKELFPTHWMLLPAAPQKEII